MSKSDERGLTRVSAGHDRTPLGTRWRSLGASSAPPVTLAPWDANCRRQTGRSDCGPSKTLGGTTVRLNKFLAERLGVSRREADGLISAGKITIDGKTADLGARVEPSSKVCYGKKEIPFSADYLYIAMNKPVGYVCSRRAQGSAPTLYDLLPAEYKKLKTVGRLDKDSSGLILLTNDGDFAFQMTHPKFHKEKIYEVSLDHPLEPLHQQMISDYGVMLDDGPSRFFVMRMDGMGGGAEHSFAAPKTWADRPLGRGRLEESCAPERRKKECRRQDPPSSYIVKIAEGRNRQIRRTFAALGYKVTRLHRTNFGPYELSGLKPGEYTPFKKPS